MLTGTRYETYFAGAQFVHFLLGPATVALAISLYTQIRRVRAMLLPVVAGLLAGSATAALSAVAVARLLGASPATQLSLAPKSVTTPIAMGVAERIGGIPSLTAVLVIVTGILGAVGGRYVFDAACVRDPAIRGCHRRCLAWHRYCPRLGSASRAAPCRIGHGPERGMTALLLPFFASWLGGG